jgi:predicted nucleic acid-binding protein
MNKVVVDNSVITKWLSSVLEENIEQADLLLTRATESKLELFAPEMTKYEAGNTILKGKKLDIPQGTAALTAFYSLPIIFLPENDMRMATTFTFAYNHKLSYYDAAYLTLAKELGATLITADKEQASTTLVKTILLSNYR